MREKKKKISHTETQSTQRVKEGYSGCLGSLGYLGLLGLLKTKNSMKPNGLRSTDNGELCVLSASLRKRKKSEFSCIFFARGGCLVCGVYHPRFKMDY